MAKGTKWSGEELTQMKRLLAKHSVRETRQQLGRSEYAVRKQMRRMREIEEPVRFEEVNRVDGEDIRRMYKRAENKVERLRILQELYPTYTKEAILAAARYDPFRESDKKWEQAIKEQKNMAKRRSYDNATKMAVVTDVMLHGLSMAQASEKHGVPVSNVDRWVRQAKEKQADFMNYAAEVEAEQLTAKQDAEAEKTYNPAYKPRPEPVFKPVEEIVNQMGYDDPERIALEAELANKADEEQTPVLEYISEDSKPGVDEKYIKAAAYDVIAIQMAMHPDSSTEEMMCFIRGVQALAQLLCREAEEK